MPGALVSNTTERSANTCVVSASLELAAYPDEDDELELLDDELFDEELVEEELLDEELLEDGPLEDELEDDEPELPPQPLSTTATAASARWKDFMIAPEVVISGALSHGRQSRFRYALHIHCIPQAAAKSTFPIKLSQRPRPTLSHTPFQN